MALWLVLDELHKRLTLIEERELIMDNPKTDELHELHPLFESGLWIFSPVYEGTNFTSNQTLSKVMNKLFGGGEVENPNKRPDFVALPNSSISIYNNFKYDKELRTIVSFEDILIVELKKGGHKLTVENVRQAEDYARSLRKAENLTNSNFICYVLGSKMDQEVEHDGPQTRGKIQIIPMRYDIVVENAKLRTFNLMEEIKKIGFVETLFFS